MRNNLLSMMMLLKRKSLSFHCSSWHSNCDIIDDCSALSSSSFSISSFPLAPPPILSLFPVLWLKFFVYKNFYDRNNGGFEERKKKEEQKRKTISTAIECDKKHFSFKLFAISLCHYYVSQSYFVINYSTVYCVSLFQQSLSM